MTDKLDIAIEHLTCALDLYHAERYYSALHSAGAAEEMLGSYLLIHGVVNENDRLKEEGVTWISTILPNVPVTGYNVQGWVNNPKNEIKHVYYDSHETTDENGDTAKTYTLKPYSLEFDIKEEAGDMIRRTQNNYEKLIPLEPDMPLAAAIEDFTGRS